MSRLVKPISAEDTFDQDVLLSETEPMIRRLAENVWAASQKEAAGLASRKGSQI
jgi:DNA polymerase-4